MAKKRTPSSSRRQRANSNSSSVQTNSFIKGMNKDITPSLENNQAWWHARNIANNSEDGDLGVIGNEPANLSCGEIPYTVIGAIHRYGDEWIVYSTDDVNSEIGRFDDSECKYETIVNDPCLNFSRKFLITGAAKENFDCTWQVYWDDGNNPSRTINIDEVPYKQVQIAGPGVNGDDCAVYEDIEPKELDCEKIRLAPLVDTPCVKLTKATDGGMLRNGAYQAYIAYVENEQRVTDYIGISNIQTLFSHEGSNGSLDIAVSNLDQDYEYYELVILRRNQGQTSAKRIGLYSTQTQDINIDFIDEALVAISLEQIPLRSPAYEKSESMFVVNDWLLRQGPVEQFDFNYQPIANEIKTEWVINQVSSDYYHLAGNKLGFMRDEQYAFFIRWIYNTGERSSSYHIPGRAPRNFDEPSGLSTPEDQVITGSNIINPSGDPLYKVYNTASITAQGLSEIQDDGSVIVAKGDMGFWQSSERYPVNRPDIWGDLCGKYIRHHKMPDESIGGPNSPLHLTNTNGDLINILGVQFSNIGRPKFNDGTYIPNVVGYEILRGSRQGARSILAKGMFKNMRKYDIPDEENLLGTSTQGLYPNYPYNSLQDDVFFHDGRRNDEHRTKDCEDSFTDSINKFKPLKGHTKDVFTFHSPDLMFTKPFLNAYETKIIGEISGKSTGTFKPSEKHPQFKLLRPVASTLAAIIGVGYALNAVQGTSSKTALPVQGDNASGNSAFFGVSNSFGKAVENAAGIGSLTLGNAIWNLLLDGLIDNAVDLADLYGGGIASDTKLKATGSGNFLKSAIPGVTGGGIEQGVVYDKPEAAMPSILRALAGISMAQKNISIGGNEIIELFYNLVDFEDFVLKYNSVGFFNKFTKKNLGDTFRVKNSASNYLGSSFQTFDGTKYKINNLFRPSTVAISTEQEIDHSYSIDDNSRFALGGYVKSDGSVDDYANKYMVQYSQPFKRNIAALYGSLKYNFDNQYGQLDGIKQIQMRGCVELLDPEKPNEFLYSSKPIFAGDAFINRYTEKCIMPIFTDFLNGQPDGFSYDYSLYVNVPYPRFWLDSTKFDISGIAREIATLGFASGSWRDKLPTAKYYLDRGFNNCQGGSLIGSLFGGGNDLNPAYNMEFAYMYSHINGVNEFFCESEINLANRDYEDRPDKRFYDIYEFNDLNVLFHADNIKADNFYKYDDSLTPAKFPTQLSSFGNIQDRDYDPLVAEKCFVSYPKRLIYSLQAQEESKRDFWRVFLNNNYKDFKNEVSVIKPINKSGALIFFPFLSPQMFQGLDTLKTGLDTKLTIGDGGLFSQPFQNVANADVSNEYGSCESLRGVINTPVGLFFISQAQGKIFQYGGKGLEPISNAGMKWWFAKYLPSRFIKQFPESEDSVWTDNPVHGVGCQVMYDSVDDTVYFMKKDYQLKPEYVADAQFTDSLSKPVRIKNKAGFYINVDIGDPLFFDDCSWTCSYDPKSKAWISFHDWHPELALPSINHFFTTKTTTTTTPQCPPGYNFNASTGLCEIAVNTTEPATITVENIASTVTGGPVGCLVDVVISMDVSGSTNQNGRRAAQQSWMTAFLTDPQIVTLMNNSQMQIGFASWDTGANTFDIPNGGSTVTMSHTVTEAQATDFFNSNWTGGGTNVLLGLQTGNSILTNTANSTLGDRTADPNYRAILILVTDTTSATGPNAGAPYTSVGAGTAPAYQFVYAMYCGANSPIPPDPDVLNNISMSSGPVNVDPYQYGIDASDPSTFQAVATAIAGAVCGTEFECDCPAGYTKVFYDAATSSYTASTGVCDNITPPICRKVTCECPPPPVSGATTTPIGTCPDSAPEIYQMVDASAPQADPRLCNFYYFESVTPNYNVGGFWRHNVRCDKFANYYNEDYPWEIDLISNTGQAVNTVRSFEYQLETYVYKGDPQYNMCGGDKWEDLDYNFDVAIVYNNDQVSGLLSLTPQPFNDPWGELNYPQINANSIDIIASKVEHKFRFNQFWDITNDRGEFTNVEQSIFDTECNGYIRPLNTLNLNYNKPPTQRKKFRHYSNHVILRRNVSGNRKMLLRLNNTKLLLSQR